MHISGYYINITILNVITSLISRNPREKDVSVKSPYLFTFSSHISQILTLKYSIKEFKPRVHMHHVVIIVIIVMVLFHNVTCYTNSILSRIHVTITYLLNIICTLVAITMIPWRLEYCLSFSLHTTCFKNLWVCREMVYHVTWNTHVKSWGFGLAFILVNGCSHSFLASLTSSPLVTS